MNYRFEKIKEYLIGYSEFCDVKKFATHSRKPFYKLVEKYLPKDKKGSIVDIGAGEGEFIEYLKIDKNYKNTYLLDGNNRTVEKLKNKFKNSYQYQVPERLPFSNNEIDFIHTSHLVEHLKKDELVIFLKEIDRVLKDNGILVISTPLLWQGFYDDFSHVKPYNPEVFINYLCGKGGQRSSDYISNKYKISKLVYRYKSVPLGKDLFSRFYIVNLLMRVFFLILAILGFRKYLKSGYSLILKK